MIIIFYLFSATLLHQSSVSHSLYQSVALSTIVLEEGQSLLFEIIHQNLLLWLRLFFSVDH